MNNFFSNVNKTEDLHHAYLFVGERDLVLEKLLDFFKNKLKVEIHGNPDFGLLRFENINVDDARAIRESSEKKNLGEGSMFFVLSCESVSIEAQNSLLKVFEEPAEKTYFFVISPQDNFLSTLKSRMQVIHFEPTSDQPTQLSKTVFDMTLKERLQVVKDIVDGISDEEGTKQDAVNFLNTIESELHAKGVSTHIRELQVCGLTRISLLDRGAPVKMILENLVLSI